MKLAILVLIVCILSSCASPVHLLQLPEEITTLPDHLQKVPLVENYPNLPKQIGLYFHFINSTDSTLNYGPDEAPHVIYSLLKAANERMQTNAKMQLPVDNQTAVLPSNIQFYLADQPDGKTGVFYHYEEEPEYFIKRGKDNNVYKRAITRQYQREHSHIINVIVQPFDPSMLEKGIEKLEQTAVALDHTIKLPGMQQIGTEGWSFAGIFNHEMGHILGLRHTWNENDGCTDTPRHSNCWNTSTEPPCVVEASNNLMDYNAHQSAITPCQIDRMHTTLAETNRQAHGLVKDQFCKKSDNEMIIDTPTLWKRSVLLDGDLVIKKGGTLKITSGLHLPEDGKIIIKKGGTLILENATLYNSCQLNWGGVELHPKGQLFNLGDANVILDMP